MANMLGNWQLTRLQRPPVNSLNASYAYKNSKNEYQVIVCQTSSTTKYINNLYVAQMQTDETFTLLGENTLERLFKYNARGKAILNIAFSANKQYAVVLISGITGGAYNTGVKFFKLDTDGRYALMSDITNLSNLSVSYFCDISPDGTYACAFSATSPYLEFYSRSGDTWSWVNMNPASITIPGLLGGRKVFDSNNRAYITNNGTDSFKAIQVLSWDSGTSQWLAATTTGLPSVGYSGLDFTNDGYYACTDTSSPYFKVFKSSNGLDFTDISSGIDSVQASQYYNPSWDPTGTYLVCCVNNATYPFIMYKRSGDTLTRLTTAFDQLPTTALSTSRNFITWSNDSKYLCIPSASGTTAPYGLWMYRRDGDNFYHIGQSYYPTNDATPWPTPDYDTPINQGQEGMNQLKFL